MNSTTILFSIIDLLSYTYKFNMKIKFQQEFDVFEPIIKLTIIVKVFYIYSHVFWLRKHVGQLINNKRQKLLVEKLMICKV